MNNVAKCLVLGLVTSCSSRTETVDAGVEGRSVMAPELAAAIARARDIVEIDGAYRVPATKSTLPRIDATLPSRARGPMHLAVDEGTFIDVVSEVSVDAPLRREGRMLRGGGLSFFATDESVEELRTLADASSPDTFRWTVHLSPSLGSMRVIDHHVEVLDRKGRARFRTEEIVAWDARGVRRALSVSIAGDAIVATLDRSGMSYPIVVDPAWGPATSPSAPRYVGGILPLPSGKVFFVGGNTGAGVSSGSTVLSTAEVFDPATLTWTATTSLSAPRLGIAPVLLPSGKVLIAGGNTTSGCLSTADIWDPATGTMTAAAPMPNARAFGGTVTIGTKVLYAGGNCNGASTATNGVVYDATANTWSVTTNAMRSPRAGSLVTPLSGTKAIVTGGGLIALQTEIWDASTNAFAAGPDFTLDRIDPAIAKLADGKILAVGGRYNPSGFAVGRAECELLDPAGGGWSPTGSLSSGRYFVSAVTLTDGRVLVGGGLSTGSTATNASDLFDPATKTWSSGGNLVTARQDSSIAPLPGGRALIVGGRSGTATSSAIGSAEIFGDASPKATACVAGGACASGFCVDGVCCDRACTGACESCSEAGSIGTCTVISGSSRPGHGSCGATTGACAGACDGLVATCTIPDATVACVAASCTAGIEQPAALCNGTGSCGATPATKACSPYVCGATACKTSCTTSADCVSTHFCDAGACVKKGSAGAACTAAAGCASGFCADGVCCNEVCDEACKSCNASGSVGTCTAVDGIADPHGKCKTGECADVCKAGACGFKPSTAACGAEACVGAALTAKGTCSGTDEKCNAKAPTACPGGLNCADATSCKTTCASPADCASGVCDAVSGTCVGATDAGVDIGIADAPRVDLGAKPSVGDFQRCIKGSDCATGFCVDGVCCDSACTDRCHSCALLASPGKCTLEPVGVDLRNECGPAAQCLGTCGPSGQCIGSGDGTMCARNRCVGPSKGIGPAYCPSPGGKCGTDDVVPFDCAPYVCEPAFGACLTGCKSSEDCANGFVCDVGSKTCVAPAAPEEGGGCAMGRRSTGVSLLFVAALVAFARRRRA